LVDAHATALLILSRTLFFFIYPLQLCPGWCVHSGLFYVYFLEFQHELPLDKAVAARRQPCTFKGQWGTEIPCIQAPSNVLLTTYVHWHALSRLRFVCVPEP
jgi:hypothetical protein